MEWWREERIEVESDEAMWEMQHQRSGAHYSFVILHADAAGQSMSSFYIVWKEDKGSQVERRAQENWQKRGLMYRNVSSYPQLSWYLLQKHSLWCNIDFYICKSSTKR